MWDAVSWVLQSTTYYYHYRHYTRSVAVITRHHSSSISSSLHSAAVDYQTHSPSRGRTLSGGGTLGRCVRVGLAGSAL